MNQLTGIQAKREELKAISAPFRSLVNEGTINSINTGLVNFYAEQGHTTLKSLRRWNNEGYLIKKGTKALLLWGEPKPVKKGEEPQQPKENEEEETFFPVAFVFSNLQVEPIKK